MNANAATTPELKEMYEILKTCKNTDQPIDAAKRAVKAEIAKNNTLDAKLALGQFYKIQMHNCLFVSNDRLARHIADELYEMAKELLECGNTADDMYELARLEGQYTEVLLSGDKYDAYCKKKLTMLLDAAYAGSLKAFDDIVSDYNGLYFIDIPKDEFQWLCYYCFGNNCFNANIYSYIRILNKIGTRTAFLADICAHFNAEKYNPQNPALQSFMANCKRTIKECSICLKFKQSYNYCCGAEHNYCIDCIARIQKNPATAKCPECREICHPRYNGAFNNIITLPLNNANVTVRRNRHMAPVMPPVVEPVVEPVVVPDITNVPLTFQEAIATVMQRDVMEA